MKVAVLNAQVPFVRGGAEVLSDALVRELRVRGHAAELVTIPFRWYPDAALLEATLATQLLKVGGADRVIAMKFPVYLVDHPDMVVWLLHQHRQVYDHWGAPGGGTADTVAGRAVRDAIRRVDDAHLARLPRYAISEVVRDRLRRFNDLDAEVLYPPLIDARRIVPGPPGDYVFMPGRIGLMKRQALAVEAFARVRTRTRLVIGGAAARPNELWPLRAAIARHGLRRRVQMDGEWLSEDEQAALYAGALAVLVTPVDEDYGLVCIEAFAAGKPVITCTDAGSPATLVEHGRSGLVVDPTPAAIGAAVDRLRRDPELAAALGAGARERLHALDLSWDRVVETLTA